MDTTAAPRAPFATDTGTGVRPALLDGGAGLLHLLTAGLLLGSGPQGSGPLVAAAVLLLALSLLAGMLRRRPLAALALTLIAATLVAFGTMGPHGPERLLGYLPADLVLGLVVAVRPRRQAIAAGVAVAGVELLAVGLLAPGAVLIPALLISVLALGTCCMAGLLVRQRRVHAGELRARAVSEAVTAERLRIARELHDMVAHSIGVVAIQAGVGRRVIATRPEEARNALEAIESTSRETLAGLRRTLVALRRAQPDGDAGPAPTGPAPGLADLDALAASFTGSGVAVDVRTTGEPRPLPPEIDLSVYRIVQEALTNVVRHAGSSARARVTVDFREEELRVEVADDGRGAAVRRGRTGFGITGMYERVGLLGGRFSAGPRPEGGFLVAAEIPLPAGVTGEGW
ncbi:sensor histidine kinase [Streptomyces sp. NPDC058157]|uniref:sensor histidine kinase n=1 Tax=Streptomyces sp. NPDC058157 TaxID=3346360 RepID=UPI0036E1B24A